MTSKLHKNTIYQSNSDWNIELAAYWVAASQAIAVISSPEKT